jgi:hypothetical protein
MTILDDVCNFPKGTDDKFRYVFYLFICLFVYLRWILCFIS